LREKNRFAPQHGPVAKPLKIFLQRIPHSLYNSFRKHSLPFGQRKDYYTETLSRGLHGYEKRLVLDGIFDLSFKGFQMFLIFRRFEFYIYIILSHYMNSGVKGIGVDHSWALMD
jgi:hypothetical protein